MAFAGDMCFNPETDSIGDFKFSSPYGDELPTDGFDAGEDTYQPPAADGSSLSVRYMRVCESARVVLTTPRCLCLRCVRLGVVRDGGR